MSKKSISKSISKQRNKKDRVKISKKTKKKDNIIIHNNKNSQYKILSKYSKGIYNIYELLINIYENIHLELVTTKSPLKDTIPSYYKCFLICVKNHIYLKKEVQYIRKFFELETTYSFDKDDINSIELSQQQLTRLNNIVEDKCPLLIKAFNPLDPQYNIPEEHEFLYNIYMSFQGFELLRSQMSYKINVKYKLGQYNGEYNIFIKKKDMLSDKFKLDTSPLLKQIATRILFYNVYLSIHRIPIFTIYYSNLKKTTNTPLIDNKLRSFNINTAATDTITKIIIWRKEELLKSIFHECNHFHSFDKILDIDMESINKFIFRSIRIDKQSYSQLELRESYTEMIANLLNLIAVISFKKSSLNENQCFKQLCHYLSKEINFSINQVGKILNHFNFKNIFQFLKLSSKSTNMLSQSTHVVSYFILKSILLINIGTIIESNNNNYNNTMFENTINNINFNLNSYGKKTIIYCIKNQLNKDSIWSIMVNKSMTTKTFKNKTLKMTSIYSD